MYQVYIPTLKCKQYGQKFFAIVNRRCTEHAKSLEGESGIPYEKITSLIFIFIRACVHYALFEDEFYLKSEIEALKEILEFFIARHGQTSK